MQRDKDLVGKKFRINHHHIKVLSKLGEGALGSVYRAQEKKTKTNFALKKLIIEKYNAVAKRHYQNEIAALAMLNPHPNIIQYFGHEVYNKHSTHLGDWEEVFMLLEYCPGGTLFNLIEERTNFGYAGLDEDEVLQILLDIVSAIAAMHLLQKPIAHRDIKLENILKGQDGKWKLCDFGSSTQLFHEIVSVQNRDNINEEIEKSTTQIYRAPEQLDLFRGYPLNEKVDIWALGCVMYMLMFFRQPFQPGEKLAQINARVNLPTNHKFSSELIGLLKRMFIQDPRDRIKIGEIWSVVDSIKSQRSKLNPNLSSLNKPPTNFKQFTVPLHSYNTNPNRESDEVKQSGTVKKPPIPQAQSQKISSQELQGKLKLDEVKIEQITKTLLECEDHGIPENQFRMLVKILHDHKDLEQKFYISLAQSQYKSLTIVAVKALSVVHKLLLYCPFLNPKSLRNFFEKCMQSWNEVLSNKTRNPDDSFRCEYFGQLIVKYASYMDAKCQMLLTYCPMIDSNFSLENYFSFKSGKNPIEQKFIERILRLWYYLTVMHDQILIQPLFLWNIRLNIITNIVEEEFLLLSLTTHLFFAFKVLHQRFNPNPSAEIKEQISKMEQRYEQNLNSYQKFIESVKSQVELNHLISKIPTVQKDLYQLIKKSQLTKHSEYQTNTKFNIDDYINIKISLHGIQIPLPFEVPENFHSAACHKFYDIYAGTKIYRGLQEKKLLTQGKKRDLIDDLLESKPRAQSGDWKHQPHFMDNDSQRQQNFQIAQSSTFNYQKSSSQKSRDSQDGVISDSVVDFLQSNVLAKEGENQSTGSGQDLDKTQEEIKVSTKGPAFSRTQQNWVEEEKGLSQMKGQVYQYKQEPKSAQKIMKNSSYQHLATNKQASAPAEQYSTQSTQYLINANIKNMSYVNQVELPQRNFNQVDQYNSNNSQQHGQSIYDYNTRQQQLIDQKIEVENDLRLLNQRQEVEIQTQRDLIQKLKDDSVRSEQIEQQEDELQKMKDMFQENTKHIIGKKLQLEMEISSLKAERTTFEKQKEEEIKKIREAKQQLNTETQRLEQQRQEIQAKEKLLADKEKQNDENSKRLLMLTEQLQQEYHNKMKSLEKPQKSLKGKGDKKPEDILQDILDRNQNFLRLKLQDLKVLKQIGAGASAEVYQGTYKETDVAIKKLRITQLNSQNLMKEFEREVSTLQILRHPNLVLFMGAIVDRGHVLIVTEYCFGGTLFSLLHEKKSIELSWKQRYTMALDIAKGMNFLHTQEPKLLHRDLKSLNLLMFQPVGGKNDYVQVKITDFGLSRAAKSGGLDESVMGLTGQAGTFHWMAPEIIENRDYTHKADVYSYGIVLWEIICREPPFKNYKQHDIIYKVVHFKERPNLNLIPADCPKELISIMTKCWDQNPDNRPDFTDIVKALKMINIQT